VRLAEAKAQVGEREADPVGGGRELLVEQDEPDRPE
jgi:hypothetical protein